VSCQYQIGPCRTWPIDASRLSWAAPLSQRSTVLVDEFAGYSKAWRTATSLSAKPSERAVMSEAKNIPLFDLTGKSSTPEPFHSIDRPTQTKRFFDELASLHSHE
jgi:hypothetical protein